VGLAHARQVTKAMTRALSPDQLEVLRDLSQALTTAAQDAYSRRDQDSDTVDLLDATDRG
jgi:hypothetical protein